MSAIAVVCFVVYAVIIWGGLVASVVFLAKRPSLETYPEGGEDADSAVEE